MSSTALQQLLILSAVTTLAVLLVTLARGPLRGMLGARAAYWLWMIVPASAIAVMLPDASRPASTAAPAAQEVFGLLAAKVDALLAALQGFGPWAAGAVVIWILGAIAAAALMTLRQRACVRSFGSLVRSPDGTWRSAGVLEPMLIGALHPRVLLPLDFERRYTAEERGFVLAHEWAHMRRGDTVVNAFGAAWLCVFWFNPVMFWAMRLLRFDQDLACDAAVLAAADRGRRGRYAGALLKAQLAGEAAALPVPLACHWRAVHPLRRRVAALRRPVAGRTRHGIGILCSGALVVVVSLAAHAVQPDVRTASTAVRVVASATHAATVHASAKVCPLSRRRALARHSA